MSLLQKLGKWKIIAQLKRKKLCKRNHCSSRKSVQNWLDVLLTFHFKTQHGVNIFWKWFIKNWETYISPVYIISCLYKSQEISGNSGSFRLFQGISVYFSNHKWWVLRYLEGWYQKILEYWPVELETLWRNHQLC